MPLIILLQKQNIHLRLLDFRAYKHETKEPFYTFHLLDNYDQGFQVVWNQGTNTIQSLLNWDFKANNQ